MNVVRNVRNPHASSSMSGLFSSNFSQLAWIDRNIYVIKISVQLHIRKRTAGVG